MHPTRAMSLTATAALALSLAPTAANAGTEASAATTAASAKRSSTVTITVQPLWSGIGEKLVARGEVYETDTYRPLANRSIVFQARNVGSSTWTTIARPETSSDGAFRVDLKPDRSKTYRAVYKGNAWYDGDHSNWERQTATPGTKVRTSVRLYQTSTGGTQVRGRLTKLWSSSIRPLRSANVYIQARQAYGTYWFDAGHTKTNGHGYYAWSTSVKPNACYRYRAIYKGNSTWAAKSNEAEWTSCS